MAIAACGMASQGWRQVGGTAMSRQWAEPDGWHIDVRGLAPPQPLVAILRLIDSTPGLAALIVHHDRDPLLLYPELAERHWAADPIDGAPGEVRLRLSPLARPIG